MENTVIAASPLDITVRGWMPIETAPQDGTYVMVSNGRGVWVAKYKAVYQSGWKPDCPWQSMMLNHDHIPRAKQRGWPTHWTPLPEAPNAELCGGPSGPSERAPG